ncbi:M14 family zinc carboxypeptidase [Ferdinandcohnia sp. Marseille-Q9671]
MKKVVLPMLLSVALIGTTLPTDVLATGTEETNSSERKHSLFNSEQYDYVIFDTIQKQLEDFDKRSNRISLEVTGKSSTGKDLYTVTITNQAKNNSYKTLRKLMSEDPDQAQRWLSKNPDVKPPILIHASIHGSEFVGTDAALRLIERFGFENDSETLEILNNFTLIVNVNANPDGRIEATRFNGEGIDLNRDFITQSQPETQAVVKQITKLNPLVLLDLHGYVKQRGVAKHPGLILPGTPPHNPNYEFDLLYNWMNQQAEAMESELVSQKDSYETELYKTMEGTHIPLRDSSQGWDVYPPIYTPAYAMLHGGYGYTLEAPTNDLDGVKWQVDAVTGALKFAVDHKYDMLEDQIEVYQRGVTNQHPNYEEGKYPEAYILPVKKEDPTVTEKAVRHLIKNDVEVTQAKEAFDSDGIRYEKGTYLLSGRQAKAAVANAFLWDGQDITNDIGAMYDISSWGLPELWGFEVIESTSFPNVKIDKVKEIKLKGSLNGNGPYKIPNTSINAVSLVNQLLQSNIQVLKDEEGNFYVEKKTSDLIKAVKASGLDLVTTSIPKQVRSITEKKIAILKDGGLGKVQSHSGTKLALERLGFSVTELHPSDVANNGLSGYDTFIYSGSANLVSYNLSTANKEFGLSNEEEYNKFKQNVDEFIEQKGQYIAIGSGASKVAKSLGLTDVEVNTGSSSSNGIVQIDYTGKGVTAGYSQDDIGFIYGPVWYSNTEETEVFATFDQGEDFFVSGHWKNRQPARGQAVIVTEKDAAVTLIGLEAGFRNHTDYLFRLLSNTIFNE